LIDRVVDELLLPREVMGRIKHLVAIDPVGSVLNVKSLRAPDDAAAEIAAVAKALDVSILQCWRTILIYFQCDVCGYHSLKQKVFVTDAAGEPVWEEVAERFMLRDKDEAARFKILEENVRGLALPAG
jgi:hypothetical protein